MAKFLLVYEILEQQLGTSVNAIIHEETRTLNVAPIDEPRKNRRKTAPVRENRRKPPNKMAAPPQEVMISPPDMSISVQKSKGKEKPKVEKARSPIKPKI